MYKNSLSHSAPRNKSALLCGQGNSIYFWQEKRILINKSGSRAALNINFFLLIRWYRDWIWEIRLRAVLRKTFMLSGECSFLALESSSRNITSRHQWSRFSIYDHSPAFCRQNKMIHKLWHIVWFVYIFTHQHISSLTLYHFLLFCKSFLRCKQRGMYPKVIQTVCYSSALPGLQDYYNSVLSLWEQPPQNICAGVPGCIVWCPADYYIPGNRLFPDSLWTLSGTLPH